jgi:prevent-host-death family protein
MQTWPMQHAKAHMSELVQLATHSGPQEITVHGKPVVVVLSKHAFDQMTGAQQSLVAFMQNSPLTDLPDEAFARNTSTTRSIEL